MLGVGRKVGSRNGSRGCCATINTPRDATRHVSLAVSLSLCPPSARSLALQPSLPRSPSSTLSLFSFSLAGSFFFSLYYSPPDTGLSLRRALSFPLAVLFHLARPLRPSPRVHFLSLPLFSLSCFSSSSVPSVRLSSPLFPSNCTRGFFFFRYCLLPPSVLPSFFLFVSYLI